MQEQEVELISFDSISRTEELEKLIGDALDMYDEGILVSSGEDEEEMVESMFSIIRRVLAQDYELDENLDADS